MTNTDKELTEFIERFSGTYVKRRYRLCALPVLRSFYDRLEGRLLGLYQKALILSLNDYGFGLKYNSSVIDHILLDASEYYLYATRGDYSLNDEIRRRKLQKTLHKDSETDNHTNTDEAKGDLNGKEKGKH